MSIGNAGGLSDHVVVDEERARLLPEEIPLDIGGKYKIHHLL